MIKILDEKVVVLLDPSFSSYFIEIRERIVAIADGVSQSKDFGIN